MIIETNTIDLYFQNLNAQFHGTTMFFKKRIQKDFQDQNLYHLNDDSLSFQLEIKNCVNNLFIEFYFTMVPLVGDFKNQSYQFKIFISKKYPYEPPIIHNLNKKLHPNIEIGTQKVFLHILDDFNWKPIYGLYEILLQLKLILINPNFKYVPNNPENINLSLQFFGENVQLIQEMEKLSIEKQQIEESYTNQNSFTSTFYKNLKIDQDVMEEINEGDKELEESYSKIPAIDISQHYNKRLFQKLVQIPQNEQNKSDKKLILFK